jgi:hypothetical protein
MLRIARAAVMAFTLTGQLMAQVEKGKAGYVRKLGGAGWIHHDRTTDMMGAELVEEASPVCVLCQALREPCVGST